MSITDTRYSARFQLPDLIERGRDNTLRCDVYADGAVAAVTPAGSTVTVCNQAGEEVVSAQAVTVVSGAATYLMTSAVLGDEDLSEGWIVEWSLVMPDGVTHTFRNDGALVRRRLYPTVSDVDLFRLESSLDPSGNDPIFTRTDFQDYLDEADVQIQLRLINEGNRPNLVTSPSALRMVWLYLWAALIFEDATARNADAWERKAQRYRDRYDREWARLSFLYDDDDDGTPTHHHDRRAATPTVWLTGRR